MATQTTGGGSTTSFTNTPQAKDDNYLFLEDVLRNNSTIYNAVTGSILLDVMANDLGGNAKSLFSVEDGDGNALTADFDLLVKDGLNADGTSVWERTFGGNWVRINNGKIEYRIADGSNVPGQGRSIDSLTDQQAFSDQFVYAIRLGNGTLSEATVKINITGANDSATIAVVGSSDNSVAEAGGIANAIPGDPCASGTLVANDADLGQNTFQAPSNASLIGTYGVFTFNAATGQWKYTLNNTDPDTQALAQGQVVSDTLTVKSLDGTASYNIVITITGTNDAPVAVADVNGADVVIEAGVNPGNTAYPGDASAIGNVLANDSDVDTGAVLTVAAVNGVAANVANAVTGTYGSVTINADGSWAYALNNADPDTQSLAQGAVVTDVFSYTVTDEHGATSTTSLTITITGTNDAPVLQTPAAGSISELDQSSATASNGLTGMLAASDVDGDTLAYGITGGAPSGVNLVSLMGNYGTLTVNTVTGAYSYAPNSSAIEGLDAGENPSDNFTVTVTDSHGSSSAQTYTLNLHGADDAPTLAPVAAGSIAEVNQSSSTISSGLSGTLVGADVDVEALSYGVVGGIVSAGVSTLVTAYGTLTVNTVTGAYSFAPNAAAIEGLDVGESPVLNLTFTVSDGDAPLGTQGYTINLTGADDAPTLAPVAAGSIAEVNQSSSTTSSGLSGTLVGSDVDVEMLTYGIQGGTVSAGVSTLVTAYGTLTVNTSTGAYNFAPNAAAIEGLDVGENPVLTFTFTVSDGDAPLGTQGYAINLTGADDAPTLAPVASGSVAEVPNSTSTIDSGLSGTLVGSDVDVETLTYGIQGGTTAAGFSTLAGTYGTLSVNISTGAYTYTKNTAAIEALNAGQNPSDNFTVTVSDGDAPLGTQTYMVNLTGANDAPVAVADKLVISTNTAATFSTSVLTANDTTQLRVTSMAIAGSPQGSLTFDAATQTFTYNSTGGTGAAVDTLTYTLSDGSTASVTIQVVNANPGFDLNTVGVYQGSYLDAGGGNDTLTGAGAPDTLLGGTGADTLLGGSGGDILRGGGGDDTLNGQGDPGQFDLVDLSDASGSITFTLGAGGSGSFNGTAVGLGTDTYSNMEGVIGGLSNDNLSGNASDNEIRGGGGNDIISGLGGNDILKGDAGNDTMTGGAGNDTFVLGPTGVDTITDYSNVAGNTDVIDVTEYVSVAAGTDVIGSQYIRVTTTGLVQIDADGGGTWVTVANVNVGPASYNIQYYSGGVLTTVNVTPSAPPIALDLDGDGQVSFLATDGGAHFDYGGGTVATAWVAANDGILVRDANGDGQISADEIVLATSGSDLDGLAAYDSNHDGQLSSADADFNQFGVWQDADSDGQVDAGELQSLTARSIASISLSSDGVGYSAAGGDVQVVGTGSYTRLDGSVGVLADAVFATGFRAEQDVRSSAVSSNNTVLQAAIAAAGLAASASAAAQPSNTESHGVSNVEPIQLASVVQAEPTASSASDAVQAQATANGAAPMAAFEQSSINGSDLHVEANHSLTGSEVVEAAAPDALLQGSEASDYGSLLAAPAMAALPAAQVLAAALADNAHGQGFDSSIVSVVAEALGDSGPGQTIDAILEAFASADASTAQSLMTIGAGHFSGLPTFASLTTDHVFMEYIALIHPDALPSV